MITKARARELRRFIEEGATSLTDEVALEAKELFPNWKPDQTYERGIRVRYEDDLYRCEQTHTSQAHYTPDMVKALWTVVAEPGEIPVWVQPTGAQDAYMMNDKVYYPTKNDSIYISTMDYNTYAPDVYGWELYHKS